MKIWDPARYLQFADDRARPYIDLIHQVPTSPSTIVDLGCGTGQVTRHLRALWPDADILGIDMERNAVDLAIRENTDPHANYDFADVTEWEPVAAVDLIVANAVLQWVPDHFAVIERLLGHLTEGGAMAVQMPDNADQPTYQALAGLGATDPYREYLTGLHPRPQFAPTDFLEFFIERGYLVNVWSTTYHHILHGPHPVYEWLSTGSARPYLQALPPELAEQFEADLKQWLGTAYPKRSWGTVLPFRRTFAVATSEGPPSPPLRYAD